jgi:hypothetical protein
MPAYVASRIVETSSTSGTGSFQLNGAVTGFTSFVAAIGNGNNAFYVATDGTNWEEGIGVVTAGTPNSLSRATIISTSTGTGVAQGGAGTAVTFPSGTKTVFCDIPASRAPFWSATVAMSSSLANFSPVVDSTGVGLTLAGPTYGWKNKVLNGDFRLWQRGTSFTGTLAGYTADGWAVDSGGAGSSATVSQLTAGIVDFGEAFYMLRLARPTAGATTCYMVHRMEDVRQFYGRQVTLSFIARCASGTLAVEPRAEQYFGTGGSPSATVQTSFGTITVTTTLTRYTATITVPSVSGKTIGTGNNDSFNLLFIAPTAGSYTFDLTEVQLEAGPSATPFERRHFATELAMAQRYYQKSYAMGTAPGTASSAGNVMNNVYSSGFGVDTFVPFRVAMRATPTVTLYSPNNGATGNCYDYSATVNRTATAVGASTTGFYGAMTGGTTVGARQSFEWAADASL